MIEFKDTQGTHWIIRVWSIVAISKGLTTATLFVDRVPFKIEVGYEVVEQIVRSMEAETGEDWNKVSPVR